ADGRESLGYIFPSRAPGALRASKRRVFAPFPTPGFRMAELSPSSTAAEVIAHLRSLRSEETRQGMKRYGIRIDRALGISHGAQRDIARTIKRNHERAF